MPKRGLTLLCAAKLHKNQLERHLELFEHLEEVERVLVVRNAPIPARLSKIENRPFGDGPRPLQAMRMLRAVSRVIQDEQVDWVIGWNPVPWGSLALLAAKRRHVRVCLSLIGMDYLQVQKPWGRPFLEAIRAADAVTVTGQKMTEGLVNRGVAQDKIHVLPHSVDIDRFAPSEDESKFDVLSVGQLISRKRMDVVLDALALLKQEGQVLRLGILGKGELEATLREKAQALGISGQVTFLGYRDDVEAVVASAKVFCLVSEWEGVPFAMMEAMAAGVPPIVTDVGTISDWVVEGKNGRIVPVGSSQALAQTLREVLLGEQPQRSALRAQLLQERGRLGFEQGAAVWRKILARP